MRRWWIANYGYVCFPVWVVLEQSVVTYVRRVHQADILAPLYGNQVGHEISTVSLEG